MGVVESLEVVEVEDGDREIAVGAPRRCKVALQRAGEPAAVGDAGERVGFGLARELVGQVGALDGERGLRGQQRQARPARLVDLLDRPAPANQQRRHGPAAPRDGLRQHLPARARNLRGFAGPHDLGGDVRRRALEAVLLGRRREGEPVVARLPELGDVRPQHPRRRQAHGGAGVRHARQEPGRSLKVVGPDDDSRGSRALESPAVHDRAPYSHLSGASLVRLDDY